MLSFITSLLTSRFRRAARRPRKTVAIVVPFYNRAELTADERISLRHLLRFLGHYDKFLIVPKGSKFALPGFETRYFSHRFFGSPEACGRLLYWPGFYKAFEDYKYVLIYHLDALVFSDELMDWCETDIDYIGAPWIPCPDLPWVEEPRVGNGGFAIMKVESALKVLNERYRKEPRKYWEDRFTGAFGILQAILRHPRRLAPGWLRGPSTQRLRERLQSIDELEVNVRHNDIFWSWEAARYLPEFKIPDWKTGLRFAFEAAPRLCFEYNEQRLPFGCHAWSRYDRAFWEPYLIKSE